MSYIATDIRPVDFSICQYGKSPFFLRGRKVRTNGRYWVCLGGQKTYAEDIVLPFSQQLERRFGVPVVNMGIPYSGPDAVFDDKDLSTVISGAEMVIFEPLSMVNHTNPFYRVHPRRNDRFICPMPALTTLYPEMDFTDCHFTKHLLCKLLVCDPARFETVRDALEHEWTIKMQRLARLMRRAIAWSIAPAGSRTEISDILTVKTSDLELLSSHVVCAEIKSHHPLFPENITQADHNQIFDLLQHEIVRISDDLALEI